MQYTVTRGEKGKVDLKVDIPQTMFDQTYGAVLGEFKKDTKIAGFRPGMAPDDLIEGKVGYNKILNEAANFLVSKHISEILKKEDLIPLDAPKVAISSLAKGAAFSFTASFTRRPNVRVGNWKALKIAKIKAKGINEADVDNSIKNIYEAYKKQHETKGAEGSTGSGEAKNVIYDSKGNAIPLTTEGKNKVEVNNIDDEFAKKIGARDLAHLRELVKKDLETIVADQVETDFEQKVFDKIATLVEVEVPEILIEDELNRILVRLGTEVERQGKTLEEFLTAEKTTVDELKAKWREQAEKNVKISMAMDDIGKSEKVQVSKEELEAALSGVDQTNFSAEQRRDLENYLVVSIFQSKTLGLVKSVMAGDSGTERKQGQSADNKEGSGVGKKDAAADF